MALAAAVRSLTVMRTTTTVTNAIARAAQATAIVSILNHSPQFCLATAGSLSVDSQQRLDVCGHRLAAEIDGVTACQRGDDAERQVRQRILPGIGDDLAQVSGGDGGGEDQQLQARRREGGAPAGLLVVEQAREGDLAS